MRKWYLALIAAVFGSAAAVSWFVVRQFPREGDLSPVAAAPVAPTPPGAPPTPPLERPATAADGFLEARVTAGGEPMRGAEVRLYLEVAGPDGAPAFRAAARGTTGEDGLARLPATPGAYLVAARAPGLAPGHAEVLRAPGEAATRAEVALAPPVSLQGRTVAREDGKPVAARVTIFPAAGPGEALGPRAAPREEQAFAATDATGALRVDGLAPGVHAVAVEAEGRHPVLLAGVALPRAEPLVVVLEGLGTIEGVALLADGRPAAGARVLAAGAEHEGAAAADAAGAFRVSVPAGSYRVVAADGRAAGSSAQPVAVAAGAATRGVALRLGPASAIEGTVSASGTGAPVAGAEVAILPHETGAIAARTAAGPDGRFRVEGLAPGAWDLRASARGRSPALLPAITLGAGQRFETSVALAGTGSVEGAVRTAAGAAIASARVRVAQRGDGLPGAVPFEVRTDFEGRYRIDGLEVGRAELVAHEEGTALGVSRAIRVAEGRTARADFFLAEAGVLAGRASPPPGAPARPLAVVAVPMRAGLGGPQAARALADATGHYRLDLPAGEYRVFATPADALRADLRVAPAFATVQPGRPVRLDLVAAAPAEERGLELVVLEPGGAPSGGAIVTLARADDGRIALATTAGEDGRVTLSDRIGLEGQDVVVRARNGGRTGAFTGRLAPGTTTAVPLAPGAAVEGTVRARGRRVDGFTLEVATEPTPGGWRTLDVHRFAADRFELGDLPPEPVLLTIRTADGWRGTAEVALRAGESRAVAIDLEAPRARASR
jgi:hypothetical protein